MSHTFTTKHLRTAIAAGTLSVMGGAIGVGLSPLAAGSDVAVAQVDATPSLFVPIGQYRTYDSRLGIDRAPDKIELKEQHDIEPAEDVDGVVRLPPEATAVSYNVTVADTERSGYIQISGAGTTFGSTSTLNWTEDGQVVANSGNVLIGEASQEFYMFLDGDSFAAAHVIIDITGYYVPA